VGPERITCVPRVHFRRPFTPNSLVSRFGYCFRWFPSTTLFLFDHRFFDFVRADFIFWIFNFFSSLIDYGVFVFYSFIFICLRFWVLFDFVLSFACCHVYLFLISGFIYSFPPFKSIYWSHLVDCCAVTLMLICIYIDTASSPHVFQVGCIRLIICARYERLRPSNTLRGLSNHNIVMKTSQNVSVEHWQSFMVSICVVLRSPEFAWAGGKTCFLLLFVAITYWFRSILSSLDGFNAALLCNGRLCAVV